ncbi:hypothetical protein O9G_004359 [Rozella allomycis CSF55]|uniref:Uncharacterized protein n=1 Tax=Rozella allomycis (strain CSF55) TaxID=988480 RepID=A0A075AZL9_ROZAC|nr:hypothetical protein O9G_004359 [Rozella allomycis CSF55]|eukprot:EPZ35702.1 hypothetical protein O9G_004359 [Rozella allomycis CSF55]
MTTGTLDMDVKMEYDWEEGRRFDFVDFCGEIVFEVCGVGGARVFQSGDGENGLTFDDCLVGNKLTIVFDEVHGTYFKVFTLWRINKLEIEI